MDYQSIYSGQEIDERLRLAGKAYQKPQDGIPASDLTEGVRESLEKADESYSKPEDGIPGTDLSQAVQESLEKAESAYQKPQSGIPSSDLASGVQTSLQKADSSYQKPQSGIPKTDLANGVQTSLNKADSAYQKPSSGIPKTDLASGVQASLNKADSALQAADLTPIEELIPEQASSSNKLADKAFVNSSVATNTANYISDNGQPFQSLADLEAYSGTLTNNDYAFVVGTDAAGNTTYTRYKYNASTDQWAEEYVLNNSSFTADQWAAISSGITALLVQKLSSLPTEVVTYVAMTLTEAQKTQARTNIGAGTYSKPSSGIPKTDLASAVQTSLENADSAYQKPQGGIPATDLASGVIPTDMVKYSPQTLTESEQMQARKNQGLYNESNENNVINCASDSTIVSAINGGSGSADCVVTDIGRFGTYRYLYQESSVNTDGADIVSVYSTEYDVTEIVVDDQHTNYDVVTCGPSYNPSSITLYVVKENNTLVNTPDGNFTLNVGIWLSGQYEGGTISPHIDSITYTVKSLTKVESKYLPIATSITAQSTDDETPSAKTVYDELATRYTKAELETMAETFTFTMADGTTVTKRIIVLPNA